MTSRNFGPSSLIVTLDVTKAFELSHNFLEPVSPKIMTSFMDDPEIKSFKPCEMSEGRGVLKTVHKTLLEPSETISLGRSH
jgi:hypothetical protein